MNPAGDIANKVAIVMGSQSAWPTMQCAADVLDELAVETDIRIVSAHRTPDRMVEFARAAEGEGIAVINAGASGAARQFTHRSRPGRSRL